MTHKILSGTWLAAQYHRAIQKEVTSLVHQIGRAPGLGVILVGDNPASHAYVANKEKLAKQCGLETFDVRLSAEAREEDVLEAIKAFNNDPRIDGILLQLPLPRGLNTNKLLDAIDPLKDADGLHPHNQGLLARGDGVVKPCTPLGSMRLIDLAFSKVVGNEAEVDPASIPCADLSGKTAVVIGRSILVGKPVSLLLLERNATVIAAHSKTKDIEQVVRSADIVVAAVGVPGMVKGSWLKEGAIVIDVGINRLPTGKLAGDVEFESCSQRAQAITPVPGGVGPMTVTMLIANTVISFKKTHGIS
jgi:methylenetetrahydrofolate dehydrogenase (NADP+)/methenyltetrahydrofolate cyclohydrolase